MSERDEEVRGDGPRTLVLLPGALGTATIYRTVSEALCDEMRCIAIGVPAEPDPAVAAKALVTRLRALGVVRADLVGTSFGGYIAQFVAASEPELISSLILTNTFADPAANPRRRAAADVEAEAAESMREAALARTRASAPSVLRDVLLAQIAAQDASAIKARQLGLAIGPAAPAVDRERIFVALIDTADDPVIAPASRDDLIARYPGAPRTTLDGGGHYPYVTNVDAYVAALRSALAAAARSAANRSTNVS